jgi:hypothetical protein
MKCDERFSNEVGAMLIARCGHLTIVHADQRIWSSDYYGKSMDIAFVSTHGVSVNRIDSLDLMVEFASFGADLSGMERTE